MSKNLLPIETAKGSLEWVVITGEGKANLSGKLEYLASLVLEGAEADALKAKIDEFWKEHKPKGFNKAPKSTGYYPHTVKTDEVDEHGKAIMAETGKTVFVFKTGVTWPDGKPKKIEVRNSKNNPVNLGDTKIGNGSIGRILGAAGIYEVKAPKGNNLIDAGVTLYLNAIKLLKLEEYVGGAQFSDNDDDAEYDAVGEEFIGEETEQAPATRTKL